jgi:LPS-assembly lipoprotein
MWWPDTSRTARLAAAFILAGLLGGCFQPLYGDRSVVGGSAVNDKLAGVDVPEINISSAPNGSPLARVGVEIRNGLLFDLTGGRGGLPPTHRLDIRLSSSQIQVIVDVNSGRPDVQNYGIDATYTLIDLATGKPVISGQTFSRVAYNIPGQQQRFAGARGLRDAENRAAKVIADNIKSRLASYFVAGT